MPTRWLLLMHAVRTSALDPSAWRTAETRSPLLSWGKQIESWMPRSGVDTGGGGGGGGGPSSGPGSPSPFGGRRRSVRARSGCGDDRLPRNRTKGRDGLLIVASCGMPSRAPSSSVFIALLLGFTTNDIGRIRLAARSA